MKQPFGHHRIFNSFRIIVLGFAAVILTGALLLMLPISSAQRTVTPFLDALFTSTTSVCVTGLVVRDTGTYWSLFGQVIILILIQIGGLGVITVAASFTMLSGKKIGLMQRSTMQEAVAAPKMSGIVRLTGFVIKATIIFELAGAVVMATVFCPDFGLLKGIWMSVFHSVSAFCNAGIDLMGVRGEYSSLTSYSAQPVINITVMMLIIIGGIGFLTWDDIRTNKYHVRRYRMQSKIILSVTLLLIILPAAFFYFHEFSYLEGGERILSSAFQSVTPRTAGFNTVDLTSMSGAAQAMIILLMLIGGSPGSTAGGMKTTTFAVIIATTVSVLRRKEDTGFFGRRIDPSIIRNAVTVLVMYLVLFFGGALVISVWENIPLSACLYETASAIGTVGLSLGITPGLGILSRCILIALMFFGRVGGITIIYAAVSENGKKLSKLPQEKITVG